MFTINGRIVARYSLEPVLKLIPFAVIGAMFNCGVACARSPTLLNVLACWGYRGRGVFLGTCRSRATR